MIDKKIALFEIVAYYKNITKAAAAANMTQVTVSRQMQQLEEEIGVPLFIRSNRGIMLTPAGEYLLDRVSSFLETSQDIIKGCRDVGDIPFSNLRLGCGPLEHQLLYEPVRMLRDRYRNVKFSCYTYTYGILGSRFSNDSVDFGFAVKRLADVVDELDWTIVYDRPWQVAAHKDHPFWNLSKEEQGRLKGQRVVTTYRNIFEPIRAYCAEAGLSGIEFLETNFMDSLMLYLHMKACITLLPPYFDSVMPEDILLKDVLEIPMREPFVACCKKDSANPGTQILMEICQSTAPYT